MSAGAIFLPLGAALIYVAATLLIKRAAAAGAGSRHVNVSVNVAMGLLMQPFWLAGNVWPTWWQPFVCGILFFLGQSLTFIALSRGDVSVATPLMGTKILFVSGFGVLLFGLRPGWEWWVSVFLSTAAVILVTARRSAVHLHAIAPTACFAIASAALFGLTDILMQEWCDVPTFSYFVAIMFTTNALLSTSWYLGTNPGPVLAPRPSRPALAGAAVLLAVQVLMLAIALGVYNDATATNILYSSRCVWSVVLAWTAGSWFGARDAEAGTAVMLRRLAGALLLFVAIFLIVTAQS